MGTTRAAVLTGPDRWWEVVELTYDPPKAHEVLVRVKAAGMCHSDDHQRTGDIPMRYPLIGGHEGSGIVEAVGPSVDRVAVGDRVVATFIPACGMCHACSLGLQNMCEKGLNAGNGRLQDGTYRMHRGTEDFGGICSLGTYSERMVVSEYSVQKLPDDIPFDVGALLSCGVPTGWGSAVRAAEVRAGDTVVIYGAGGVGSNAVQGAAMSGAARVVVVDPNPARRESARIFGATDTFEDHESALSFVTEQTWGRLADHAILTVGVMTPQIFAQAFNIVGKRGKVIVTALGKLQEDVVRAPAASLAGYEKTIRGALFGSCRPLTDVPLLIDLYRKGQLKLDELISNRYKLDEVNEGFRDLLAGKNIRGVITFD